MRLVARFALIYFLASCLLFFLVAYRTALHEVVAIEKSTASDLSGLAIGLSAAVESTWDVAGENAALGVLRSSSAQRSDVSFRWLPGETGQGAENASTRLLVSAPVIVGGIRRGSIELVKPAIDHRAVLVRELLDEGPFAFLLALLGAGLATVVGGAVIGKPLQRIVAQARRIGEGDFSGRLRDRARDEIGDLKRALNAMCEQLEAARVRVEEESNARVETLEQLRHLDRLRTVGTIASGMAHELGTPLNVVLIRAQSLVTDDVEADDVRASGAVIAQQVEKISKIVRQMLDFSRKRGAAPRRLSARALATQAASLLRSIGQKHGVDLVVEVEQDGFFAAEENQIEQALTNLLINGIHAMHEGGTLRLRVTLSNNVHPPESSRLVDTVRFDVVDTGTGIAENELSLLFQPFYTTKPPGIGTGLGLTVAKGIVDDYGGWISATSTVGSGSTFSLHLLRA
jgi:signal transduction histidine kinase